MKLLVVSPYYPPHIGGVENIVYRTCNDLTKKYKHKVTVVTTGHENITRKVSGIKIRYLKPRFRLSNTPLHAGWYNRLKEIIKEESPDVVITHSPVPYLADMCVLACRGTPVIFYYHAGSMVKDEITAVNIPIRAYEKWILPAVLDQSTQIVYYSPQFEKKFASRFGKKMVRIPPGVDTKIFHPGGKRKPHTLLYVGRIDKESKWKGIPHLIDAVAIIKRKIPDIELRIVGSGNWAPQLQEYCQEKGLSTAVKFVGKKVGAKLCREYQQATVLILPSTTEAESFGMVLVEAMACKTPTIGSDVGGVSCVIQDNHNGLLVPPKDSNALARAVERLLKSNALQRRLGAQGHREVAKRYSWDTQVRKMQQVLTKVRKS